MAVLSDKSLRLIRPVEPFVEQEVFTYSPGVFGLEQINLTFGLSACGYDIRIDQDFILTCCEGSFKMASSMEEFNMPNDVMGVVHDKSSWARRGLSVFNTVIEPGWRGFLTLELKNISDRPIILAKGCPIAQVVFHKLDQECERPYNGKYQDQERGPQNAR